MKYRLIAIDIDDTLINATGMISERNLLAVKAAAAGGVKIVLATGRSMAASMRYYRELELDTPMINFGGAVINQPGRGEIWSCMLSNEETHSVIDFVDAHDMYWHVYIDDQFCYPKTCEYSGLYANFSGTPGRELPSLRSMDIRTPKLLVIGGNEELFYMLPRVREKFPTLNICSSRTAVSSFIEINNKQASKGAALKYLTEYYGFDREEVMAIGDCAIDLSMIEYAGTGIAVENAPHSLRAAADIVVPSNLDNGVAAALERYVL